MTPEQALALRPGDRVAFGTLYPMPAPYPAVAPGAGGTVVQVLDNVESTPVSFHVRLDDDTLVWVPPGVLAVAV